MISLATLALALASPTAPVEPPRSSDSLDHEAVARKWLEDHGRDPAQPPDLDRILEEDFVRARVGAFELRVPPEALTSSKGAQQVVDVIDALWHAQRGWLGWFAGGEDPELAAALVQLEQVMEYTDDLKGSALKKAEPGAGADLWTALAPEEEITRALAELGDYLGRGGPLALEGERSSSCLFAVLPRRRDFIPFACVVGYLDPPWRHVYWAADMTAWTHFEYGGRRAVALEFASPGAGDDFGQGIAMASRNPRGAAEHVAQLGARTLFETSYGEAMESLLAVALANNLVIELYGEVDTRNDGDAKARSVGPRSVFVAGGNPSGGILPPANADSRWRAGKGKGYFVRELREAQKKGGKSARSKWGKRRGFELLDDSGGQKLVIEAPFLGERKEGLPPETFRSDYVEFLRAYRAAFFHWLQEEGAGAEQDSRRAFAGLLRDLGQAADDAVATHYDGAPLSQEAPDEGSLEGRFLLWLSKQR